MYLPTYITSKMRNNILEVFFTVLFIFSLPCLAQRKFLFHEGSNPSTPKRDYVNPYVTNKLQNGQVAENRDNISQFPSLGKPLVSNSNLSPVTNSPTNTLTPWEIKENVSPQLTTPKTLQQNSGRVKDLVNFYDNKKGQNGAQPPSYSSILQSNTNHNNESTHNSQSLPTPPPQAVTTKKNWSFSDILSGSNKPSTAKPKQSGSSFNTSPNKASQTSPSVVLPSTILNSNRNQVSGSDAISDAELQTLSEELLRKDTNNAAKFITVNYQQKTTSQSSEDKAPLPLVTIQANVWNIPTIDKFIPLLDNYERDTMVNEYVTPQERNEENAFMEAIMSTTVIRHLMNFLKEKGHVTPDPRQQRDFLKQLWFSLYSRGKGKISSSGFEHVFVSEIRNQDVLGLHNWIYFAKEEAANRANYLGYLKYLELNDKGVVMKLHFNQQGVDKPVNSMFIGTSPELEMALYTICFVTRADSDCKLKLAGKDVSIVTHTFRYRSKNLIGSAYPQI